MNAATPGQAAVQSADLPAIAAYAAWRGDEDTMHLLDDWTKQPEPERVLWRSVGDAVSMAIAAQDAPGPDVCECGHYWAHHAFSDDVCAVVDCPCTRPRPVPKAAPELAAAMAESRKLREILARVFGDFSTPDSRLMRHASVTASTITRWKREAGLPS